MSVDYIMLSTCYLSIMMYIRDLTECKCKLKFWELCKFNCVFLLFKV